MSQLLDSEDEEMGHRGTLRKNDFTTKLFTIQDWQWIH